MKYYKEKKKTNKKVFQTHQPHRRPKNQWFSLNIDHQKIFKLYPVKFRNKLDIRTPLSLQCNISSKIVRTLIWGRLRSKERRSSNVSTLFKSFPLRTICFSFKTPSIPKQPICLKNNNVCSSVRSFKGFTNTLPTSSDVEAVYTNIHQNKICYKL